MRVTFCFGGAQGDNWCQNKFMFIQLNDYLINNSGFRKLVMLTTKRENETDTVSLSGFSTESFYMQ